MRLIFGAAVAAVIAVAGCDKADEPAAGTPPAGTSELDPPAPVTPAGERARSALGEASQSARETMENLGEAGKAGIQALDENAPEIRQGLSNAGRRLKNAAGALIEDPDRVDMPGDSQLDPDETPEALEPKVRP